MWERGSTMEYLNEAVRPQAIFLPNFHGVAPTLAASNLALLSGQGPNPATLTNCERLSPFATTGTAEPGQLLGTGCLYPTGTPTLFTQLDEAKVPWKVYSEQWSRSECPQLKPNDLDLGQTEGTDRWSFVANAWLYFDEVRTSSTCGERIRTIEELRSDLTSASHDTKFHLIAPTLCSSGHHTICEEGIEPALRTDQWLSELIPAITRSAVFRDNGLLLILFDSNPEDASGCCAGQQPPNVSPDSTNPGGGRVGALILNSAAQAGTDETEYNTYGALCLIETLYNLPRLGYAADPATVCPQATARGSFSPL